MTMWRALTLVPVALLAVLWIRQVRFERYMEKRARLPEIGIAETRKDHLVDESQEFAGVIDWVAKITSRRFR